MAVYTKINHSDILSINKIFPIFDKNVTLINEDIEDEDINNILDNTENKKNILVKNDHLLIT